MKIKEILKKDKKAVLGLDVAKLFVLAILALVIISVVTLIILDSLRDTTDSAGNSFLRNQSESIINNTTGALADFFEDAGTWFTLIGVVIIILIISVVIRVVNGFGTTSGSRNAFN